MWWCMINGNHLASPSQDEAVGDFYDVMFRHWEKQLHELHAARQARRSEAPSPELVIIDDDGDGDKMAELEKQSLAAAEKGIIVDGYEKVDDLIDLSEVEEPQGAEKMEEPQGAEKIEHAQPAAAAASGPGGTSEPSSAPSLEEAKLRLAALQQ